MNRKTWHERVRRLALLMLGLAVVALVVILCPAQLVRFGFEESEGPSFDGPYGGGAYGGNGGGRMVEGGEEDFIRSGHRAVRLEVWDDGSDKAISWAGIMQTLACDLRRRVQAGVWLYFSSTVLPLQPGALAQLRVEYFEDAEGTQLIPGYVYVSPPLDPAIHAPDTWHHVEINGRIPSDSRSLRVSVVVMGQAMRGQAQAVWVDDMYVEMQPTRPSSGLRRLGRTKKAGENLYARL